MPRSWPSTPTVAGPDRRRAGRRTSRRRPRLRQPAGDPVRRRSSSATRCSRRWAASSPTTSCFDRAAAQFPDADDLARFLAGYTAVMNVVSIAFLVLVAGPLIRRFGLRLGISANPVVLLAARVVMLVVLGVSGGASVALLVVVSAARILDIALTDGTTRTSINAMYQVLPSGCGCRHRPRSRGSACPWRSAPPALLVLALNALPSPLTAIIVTTVLVCAAWMWAGVLLYRAYGPALVDALRERRLLDGPVALGGTTADLHTAERLLESPDPRSARLGLELVGALAAPEDHARAGVPRRRPPRVRCGSPPCRPWPPRGMPGRARPSPRRCAPRRGSDDAGLRARAALALTSLDDVDRLPIARAAARRPLRGRADRRAGCRAPG